MTTPTTTPTLPRPAPPALLAPLPVVLSPVAPQPAGVGAPARLPGCVGGRT